VRYGRAVADDELICPRCDLALASFSAFEAQLHRCERCDGVWVPTKFVVALAKKPELRARLMPLARRTAGTVLSEVTPALAKPAFCAACRAKLARFEAGGSSRVFLDTCKAHGTWFDKDELGRVVAFLHANPKAELAAPEPEKAKRGRLTKAKKPTSSSSTWGDNNDAEVAVGVLAFILDILF
jgi:Zn-finger nucleic acid-binding protein